MLSNIITAMLYTGLLLKSEISEAVPSWNIHPDRKEKNSEIPIRVLTRYDLSPQ